MRSTESRTGTRVDAADLAADVAALRPEFEEMLRQAVEIPTVSSDPERKGEIARGAEFAARLFTDHGGEARVVRTAGNPVVVGFFAAAAAQSPTLTVYNHMDVQPAYEEVEGWKHPPFRFTIDGDRYLGRGATDDKGPALTAFFAAKLSRALGIPLHLRFIWEFEEEVGSPSFDGFLKAERASLATDSILVSDTVWVSRERPAISYGLRGLLGMAFRLRTGTKDVHSGLTGGGARNPFGELADLLGRCHDPRTGKIKIPGVYDAVRPLKRTELDGFLASGFKVEKWKRDHGLTAIRSTDRAAILKAIWASPTFEVHGWGGGYTGPAIKTVVPPFAEAKVSMRLVPDQNPKDVLAAVRQYVRKLNPDVEVVTHGMLAPFLGPRDGALVDAASAALRAAYGKSPALVREGGSIGAVVSMQKQLRAPILLLGLSLPEHGYHAPNEYYDWGQASVGMRAFVHYFDRIAALGR